MVLAEVVVVVVVAEVIVVLAAQTICHIKGKIIIIILLVLFKTRRNFLYSPNANFSSVTCLKVVKLG